MIRRILSVAAGNSLCTLTLELGHQTSLLLMFLLNVGVGGEVGDPWILSPLDVRPKHPDCTLTLERRSGDASWTIATASRVSELCG